MNKKKILKTIVQVSVTLVGISFIVFGLVYLAPGDPIRTMYISSGNVPSEEIIEQTREAMGLNEPFLTQYFNWLTNVLSGDFGMSYSLNKPVIDIIMPRFMKSVNLAVVSMVLMMLISFPLGILAAIKANKPIDYIIRAYTSLGISMPSFFVGTILLYTVALKLKLLPVVSVGGGFETLILPAVTLAFVMSAKYIRQIRGVVLEELNKDYVAGGLARGIKFREIIIKDVLLNCLFPFITLLGLSFGSLLSGVAVVEVIFSYPGIGSLAVDAITAYDYPLIQAYVLLISIGYMSVNLLVDVAYNYFDPRVKIGETYE